MQKRRILSALAYAAGGAALFFIGSDPALAVQFNDVARNLNNQAQGAADLISSGSYLVGAGFGVQAALKFKEHNDNPQQVKLSKPLTYALVAGALLALPTFLSVAPDSAFGGGGQQNSIHGNVLGSQGQIR